MVAGEAKHPRRHLKTAFKTIYWRFGLFFVGSALCVGIVIPYSQSQLDNSDSGTADGSPYIIAMHLMGISVLPHIVNALLCTSIISAGNAYFYCCEFLSGDTDLDHKAYSISHALSVRSRPRRPRASLLEEVYEQWHPDLLFCKT